jgi:hypothetical protein
MSGYILDAGALIALERDERHARALIHECVVSKAPIVIPAAVLAQAWRDGKRQARLAHLLKRPMVEVEPLDRTRAFLVGLVCGASGTADVVDASVALCGRVRRLAIITSDPDDLARIDPTLELVAI